MYARQRKLAPKNTATTYNLLGPDAAVVGHWYPAASLNLYPYEEVKSSRTAGPREPG